MILAFMKEKAGALTFALAASAAPITLLIPSSCGAGCAACPAGGGCLVLPAVAAGIGMFGLRSRIRAGLDRVWIPLKGIAGHR